MYNSLTFTTRTHIVFYTVTKGYPVIRAGIVGATGYTGEEILRILSHHPHVEVSALSALVDSPVGFSKLFPRYQGVVDNACEPLDAARMAGCSDVVFLALPHTVSLRYVPQFLARKVRVIDLSADYRLPAAIYQQWYHQPQPDTENLSHAVYGLPELYAEAIKDASLVANPGCYPTATVLALAPLFAGGYAKTRDIVIDAKSGVTGAGRKMSLGLLYGEVDGNAAAYKIGAHQHSPEIAQELSRVSGADVAILFVPHLIPLRRGILTTSYVPLKKEISQREVDDHYTRFYSGKPFVRYRDKGVLPAIRDVVHTNYCDIAVSVQGPLAVVVSAIDNLTKGAAGQAVQNMNLMFGLKETEGFMRA